MGAANSTLFGWTIVLAIAGFVGWREWDAKQKRLLQKTAGQKMQKEQRNVQAKRDVKKDEKVKRQRAADSQPEKPKEKETAPVAVKEEQPKSSNKKKATYSSDDDAANNREFARQLSSAKQGTKLTAKSKEDVKQKSVKQSRADEAKKQPTKPVEEPKVVSPPSSTAGIDADDDQSSAASPVAAPVADSGDVSDMLEKPASAGPSVLRLTDTEDKKKPQKAKAPQPTESKKQRQNRKKVEAAKAMREEAEAERKVLLEAQRRTAREAEGRAAKDGSGFMAAQAKGNVWTGGKDVNGSSNDFLPVQPLDTAEPSATQPSSKTTQQKQSGSANKGAKGDTWVSSIPTEEEQIKMMEDEDSWSTVPAKARKTKKNKEGSATESMDEGAAPEKKPAAATVPAPAAAAQPAKKPVQAENQRPVKTFSQTSSFAALNADGAADLEEEEWDI